MAEAIGLIASGISIAQLCGQVATSIIRLKNYWDRVQNAPANIKHLIDEIDCLSLILSHIQHDEERSGLIFEDYSLQRSLSLCRDGTDVLRQLVDDLERKIKVGSKLKRKIGAAKVALKKEDIKQLKERLETAIRLISLAYQCHTNAMVRLQPEIIVARLSTILCPPTVTSSNPTDTALGKRETTAEGPIYQNQNNLVARHYLYWASSRTWLERLLGSLEYHKQSMKHRGKQREEINARYQLPTWLACQTWEVCGYQDRSGWRLHLQIYRTLQNNAPIFRSARSGNLQWLKTLISTREGFVSDRDRRGRTPLHYAAFSRDADMCQLLISEGADVCAMENSGWTPLHFGCTRLAPRTTSGDSVIRVLIKGGSSEILIEDYKPLGLFSGHTETFSYLIQQCFPPLSQAPAQDLIGIILDLVWQIEPNTLNLIYMLLQETMLGELAAAKNNKGETLLHLYTRERLNRGWSVWRDIPWSSWRIFVRSIVQAGGQVSSFNAYGESPLYLLGVYAFADPDHADEILKEWLWDIKEAGIDLEAYGESEFDIHQSLNMTLTPEKMGYQIYYPSLMSFCYGPLIEDWHFWFVEPTDQYFGEFWQLVEKGSVAAVSEASLEVPGSWPHEEHGNY